MASSAVPPPSSRPTGTSVQDIDGQTFDYVIVGGGTAGLAAAVRLSEDPAVKVAVLEAGLWRPDDPKIDYPIMMAQVFGDKHYDWCIKTVPQANANNRQVDWPRGKVLGGSSALNFMVFQRGHKREFDDIESLGNPGWGWNSMLPFYKKTANHSAPVHLPDPHLAFLDKEAANGGGPINTSFSCWYAEPHKLWVKALQKLGLQANKDSQEGANAGLWASAGSIDVNTGKRSYAANSYYAPVASTRKNLKVLCGALATRIALSEGAEEPTAEGVDFVMEDAPSKKLSVRASKEVILTAGTIKTPQLLELSGIGRKEALEKAGIKQRVDLPGVGENLSEHIYLGCAYEVQDGTVTWDKMRDAEFAAQQMQLYTGKGPDKGLIGSFVSGFAYFNLQSYLSPEDQKLVHQQIDETDQKGWSSGMKELHALQKKRYEDQTVPAMEQMFAPGFFAHSGPPKEDKSYFTLLSALQHPWSRGSIHVRSNDPLAQPDIDPKYFSSKADLTILSKALAWNDTVVSQEPLKEVVNTRQEPNPDLVNDKAEDWENAVKGSFQTTYHHLGTASMMPREKGGVVSPTLQVYGVKHLRVADASILPCQLSAHIQATVYAIAEKLADILKKQHAGSSDVHGLDVAGISISA